MLKPLDECPQAIVERCRDRASIYYDGWPVFCVMMAQAGYLVPEGRFSGRMPWEKTPKKRKTDVSR